MIIKTITDDDTGRKWEYCKKSDNQYYCRYYEFYKAIGWKLIAQWGDHNTGYYTKDLFEFEFDIAV